MKRNNKTLLKRMSLPKLSGYLPPLPLAVVSEKLFKKPFNWRLRNGRKLLARQGVKGFKGCLCYIRLM
ncbi:hypothetical protein [Campylobacter sp. CN_NA1]|uniref:hypothetical protein n=1 Tax=Campylobacter sp. CN_NA1 TaxID=2984150 RepID=UPI0022E9BDDC|nr:hypothetical protein [Campylobacter sp. CN_NA1]MDA3056448.1 hypothetical protein [Campylobacter sp. CN_NA1]